MTEARTLFDQLDDGLAVCDRRGVVRYVNDAMCRRVGRRRDQMVGRKVAVALWAPLLGEALERVSRTGRPERIAHTSDLGGRWYEDELYLADDELVILRRDVTEQRATRLRNCVLEDAAAQADSQERRLYEILDALPVLVALVGRDQRYRFVNRRYQDWSGEDPRTLLGRHVRDVLGEGTYQRLEPLVLAALGGEVVSFEVELLDRQGGVRHTRGTYVPLRRNGGWDGYVALIVDATDEVRAERALRASESRLHTLLELLPIGVGLVDCAGRWTLTNPAIRRFVSDRIPSHDPDARHRWRVFRPDGTLFSPQEWPVARAVRGETVVPGIEALYREEGGHEVWTRISAVPTPAEGGGVVVVIEDIDARRRAVDQLRESEERFRVLADDSPVPIWVADAGGPVQFVNRAFREFFGLSPEGSRSTHWHPVVHPEDLPVFLDTLTRATRRRRPYRAQVRVKRADGRWRWMDLVGRPRFSPSGTYLGYAGSGHDITESKEAEQALELVRERFEAVSRATNDAVYDWDFATNALSWNEAVQTLFGYGPAEVGPDIHWWTAQLHPEDRDRVIAGIDRAITEGDAHWVDEYRFRRRDGSYAILFDRGIILRDALGRPTRMVGAMQDVTEARQAEEALRRQQQLMATLTDNASLGLFLMDARHHCTFMNPAAERITGFRLDEVQGRPLHEFVMHTRPDGQPYPFDACPIHRALVIRSRIQGEDVFVHEDGHFYPVAFTASPIVHAGEPVGTVLEVRDTTEEQATERRLRAAIAARDDFLSVASHELRTPLTALTLQLHRIQKLVRAGGADEKVRKGVDVAVRQAARLETLVGGLLNVSRLSDGRLQLVRRPVDLSALVRESAERLGELAERSRCELRLHLPDSVIGDWDRDRIDEVVTNLLGNALKYGAGRPVDVSVDADDEVARLRVRDRGIGVRPEDRDRIFGRFERAVSSEQYGGLGLGLFITRRIVEAHGGDIAVEPTESGGGTLFVVHLPRRAPAEGGSA